MPLSASAWARLPACHSTRRPLSSWLAGSSSTGDAGIWPDSAPRGRPALGNRASTRLTAASIRAVGGAGACSRTAAATYTVTVTTKTVRAAATDHQIRAANDREPDEHPGTDGAQEHPPSGSLGEPIGESHHVEHRPIAVERCDTHADPRSRRAGFSGSRAERVHDQVSARCSRRGKSRSGARASTIRRDYRLSSVVRLTEVGVTPLARYGAHGSEFDSSTAAMLGTLSSAPLATPMTKS